MKFQAITGNFAEAGADALAVAVCHHFQNGNSAKKKTSWEGFVKENPSRVR